MASAPEELESELSAVITFRALNFLIENFGLKWNSDLTIMSGEMEPCAGQPSGDPAMAALGWRSIRCPE